MGCHIKMSNKKPIISFTCAAIRDYRYRGCYDSLAKNSEVPFEVIFVGNKPPKETMPDNFKYIETNVKPAQCYEISVREATGDYVQLIADDEDFDDGYMNRLYKYTLLLDMDKVLISARLRLMVKPPEFIMIDAGCVFDAMATNAPFCGFAPLFRRDLWNKLGGIDKRFNGSLTDLDMQMRFYEYGLNPFITPDCIASENNYYDIESRDDSLLVRTGDREGKFLRSLWTREDGTISKTRLSSVQSFVDNNILIENQGE